MDYKILYIIYMLFTLSCISGLEINKFNGHQSPYNITFGGAENITVNLTIENNASIFYAVMNLTGIDIATKNGRCYQESYKILNQTGMDGSCALKYDGNYEVDEGVVFAGWSIQSYLYDGDIGTCANPDETDTYSHLYINVTKPYGADRTLTNWSVHDSGGNANLTITESCWDFDSDKLWLRGESLSLSTCLHKDSLVNTKNGVTKIIDLNIGDYVYSYNHTTNNIEFNRVTKIYEYETNDLNNEYYYIYYKTTGFFGWIKSLFNSNKVISTYDHKFYTQDDYKMAKDLTINDKLYNRNSEWIRITKIDIIDNYDDYVYDIEVENNHNFYVDDILVHNELVDTGTEWSCYNDTGWVVLRTNSDGPIICEEAMSWVIDGDSSYPENSYISINNTQIWNYPNEFNETFSPNKTEDFLEVLNDALNNGNCDCNGCSSVDNNCTIDVIFHSDTAGILQESNTNIAYQTITCYCPGDGNNWNISMSEYCNIDSDCDIGAGNLTFYGEGNYTCNSNININQFGDIPNNSIFYVNGGCNITLS